MAETEILANVPQSPARGNYRQRGGRGRQDSYPDGSRRGNTNGRGPSNRGPRGSYRGRGRGQNGIESLQHPQSNGGRPSAPELRPNLDGSSVMEVPTTQGTAPRDTAGDETTIVDDSEGDVCFICASKIVHTSIAPCNHQTCHICALRLRALYKTRACAHCRTEAPFVIFTDNPLKRYEEFQDSDFTKIDDNLGIKYEKDEIYEDTVLLLRYNCPEADCDTACLGWPHLHRHVKAKHGKTMCDLCTRNKKVFTHEHELFTFSELRKHEKFGDDDPGAIDQSGFKGHPECGFCRERFYGDDELYTHCRDKHEKCHICDRKNNGRQPQYYLDYEMLEEHFRKDHFLCYDQECLAKKFVVFESEMDLKAHQLSEHPNGLTKDARRDARLVDISGFDYRTPYQPQRGGRREGRGGGRGRDPNSEPLPMSSAQPMRRDELAYQRQMAIQSAQSVSTRNFGGQLTPTTREPARPAAAPRPAETLPPVENLSISSPQPAAALTPQEQARRLRHNAVMERASNLLRNDALKITDFRTKVSSYKSSTITAANLIDAFFSLFDVSSAELGKLIKELAEIYENEAKRTEILKAWNDWRAINEDYPSLPGPNGLLPGLNTDSINTSSSGRRVLRLKSSTAQSSRSAVSRHGSWGNALQGGQPFPALSPIPTPQKKAASAWANTAPPKSTISAHSSRPTPSKQPFPSSSEAFPALPASLKPNTLMAGVTKGTVRWDDSRSKAPSLSAWGGTGTGTPASSGSSATGTPIGNPAVGDPFEGLAGGPPAGNGKGRGKGRKGKEVLYAWG